MLPFCQPDYVIAWEVLGSEICGGIGSMTKGTPRLQDANFRELPILTAIRGL
jgi:hypothetical protein